MTKTNARQKKEKKNIGVNFHKRITKYTMSIDGEP